MSLIYHLPPVSSIQYERESKKWHKEISLAVTAWGICMQNKALKYFPNIGD